MPTQKTLLLAGSLLSVAVLTGCAKNDSTAAAESVKTKDTLVAPVQDYATYYKDGTSYIAADREILAPLKDGTVPPTSKVVVKTDGDGNKYVFIDSGATTAADLIAGFEMNNPGMLK